jgi:hypothetical protein
VIRQRKKYKPKGGELMIEEFFLTGHSFGWDRRLIEAFFNTVKRSSSKFNACLILLLG